MMKILVIAPAWVGDMIMAQSLFKLLKQQHPECILDCVAPPSTYALCQHIPEINRAYCLPVRHGTLDLKARWQLAKEIKQSGTQYNQALVLPNSFKSALIPWFCQIPRRIGYVGEFRYPLLNDCRPLDKQRLPRMIDRFCALALDRNTPPMQPPYPSLNVDNQTRIQVSQRFSLQTAAPVLALCPGAEYGSAKRWPAEYFAEVAKSYLERSWQVVIFGSGKEAALGERIANALAHNENVHNLCGKTTLSEAISLLSLAHAVVTNDSGLMHIASALQRPLVAVYGSTDPSFTPPLSHNHSIVRLGLHCSPCFKRECPLGHTFCLNGLTPEKVSTALEELL